MKLGKSTQESLWLKEKPQDCALKPAAQWMDVGICLYVYTFAIQDAHENTPLAKDLLHPSPAEEKRKHKKKCLVQSPSSYVTDVKCPGCYHITTVFSHAQTVVLCVGCSTVLCQPTGGKARLTEGCSFRRKQH
ncbi:small ribosomal subunit protein eS27-like [Aotus nancymaae]|uniref:small ribosomal subunit protein eS27-like n=1 Tax=Aotus nancymaae TaxID=37293 RepID=UPI0030FE35F5